MQYTLSLSRPSTSLIKSLSWRMLATLTTIIISYAVTKEIKFAMTIGGIEVIAKILLYYVHERVWCRISKLSYKIEKL